MKRVEGLNIDLMDKSMNTDVCFCTKEGPIKTATNQHINLCLDDIASEEIESIVKKIEKYLNNN